MLDSTKDSQSQVTVFGCASGPDKIQAPDPGALLSFFLFSSGDFSALRWGCDYRHTDFVELTAPLLKSSVLLGKTELGVSCQEG